MTEPPPTSVPDWLVERVVLDEVPAASHGRIDRADARELAQRAAALREANARELAMYPVEPAVALLRERVAAETRRSARARRVRRGLAGIATSMAVLAVVAGLVFHRGAGAPGAGAIDDGTHAGARGDLVADNGVRAKGRARLVAFRQVGDDAERLEDDTVVRAGDIIQLRYNAGGKHYGVIASVDGAGNVTLHYPLDEAAPAAATAVAAGSVALPHAYQLDDAPRFERFVFITADDPIDVQQSLAALRAFAQREDAADAPLDLPPGLAQAWLRLRKQDSASSPAPSGGSP
jgi:hypothetical protein